MAAAVVRQTAQFAAVGANVSENESSLRQILLPGTFIPGSESAEERKVSHSLPITII